MDGAPLEPHRIWICASTSAEGYSVEVGGRERNVCGDPWKAPQVRCGAVRRRADVPGDPADISATGYPQIPAQQHPRRAVMG